jgi:hypothetical protein
MARTAPDRAAGRRYLWRVIIAGAILLALAVGAFFLARHQKKRLAALGSTETVPCNALVADQACEVVGQAKAGPDGALTAPASGKQCVWHRHKVTQHWEEWDRDSKGEMRRENKSRVVSDETSTDLFTLRDAAGEVLVNPVGATVDDPVKSHDVRSRRGAVPGGDMFDKVLSALDSRTDEEIEVEEWIVPPDETLYVRGNPVQVELGLIMNDPRDGHFLISTRSEEQLAGSAQRWAVVATVVAGFAAVGGLGLLVAGAVS